MYPPYNRTTASVTAFVIAGVFLAVPVCASSSSNQAQTNQSGFFHRHPKLKKFLIIGGVGAATGGIGAAVMGKGVASGAVMGAGSKIGEKEASDKYKEHKQQSQKQVHGKVVSNKNAAK